MRWRMRIRWLVVLLTTVPLLGCSASSRQKPGLEPTAPFLFARDDRPTPCEQQSQTGPRVVIRDLNYPAHDLLRADHLAISRAELPVFSMRLGQSSVEISGEPVNNYSVQMCAEAGAATESDARSLLDEVKLTRADSVISLSTPKFTQEQRFNAFVRVQAPPEAPITINGDYAAMRVIGTNAPVHLYTTHARITLLDTTGDVDAKAAEFGVIDFSGNRGNVRLDSAWEINLNFTGQKFDGCVDARAVQAVRVLLPPGFTSGFEAIVQHKADLACRADICARVSSHKRDGKFVFSFGSGDPALHFISQSGPVVIDSVDRLPAISKLH